MAAEGIGPGVAVNPAPETWHPADGLAYRSLVCAACGPETGEVGVEVCGASRAQLGNLDRIWLAANRVRLSHQAAVTTNGSNRPLPETHAESPAAAAAAAEAEAGGGSVPETPLGGRRRADAEISTTKSTSPPGSANAASLTTPLPDVRSEMRAVSPQPYPKDPGGGDGDLGDGDDFFDEIFSLSQLSQLSQEAHAAVAAGAAPDGGPGGDDVAAKGKKRAAGPNESLVPKRQRLV